MTESNRDLLQRIFGLAVQIDGADDELPASKNRLIVQADSLRKRLLMRMGDGAIDLDDQEVLRILEKMVVASISDDVPESESDRELREEITAQVLEKADMSSPALQVA